MPLDMSILISIDFKLQVYFQLSMIVETQLLLLEVAMKSLL